MIRIECENVQLQSITPDDLEIVRRWRNMPHVVQHMQYREEITIEQQQKWFLELPKDQNLYFKIVLNEQPIGLIHLKDIHWQNKTAEAGIFMGEKEYMGTITPMISILVLMKTAFGGLGLQTLYAKISKKNINSIHFNQQFGYVFLEEIDEEFERYVCTKSSFYSPNSSISRIQQLFAKNAVIHIHVDALDGWILEHLKLTDKMFHLHRF